MKECATFRVAAFRYADFGHFGISDSQNRCTLGRFIIPFASTTTLKSTTIFFNSHFEDGSFCESADSPRLSSKTFLRTLFAADIVVRTLKRVCD